MFSPEGRLVWSQESQLAKGTSTVEWNGLRTDGSRVPRGLYFVKLTDGASGTHVIHKVVMTH